MEVFPVAQIRRAIEQHRTASVDDAGADQHQPFAVLAPDAVITILDQVESGWRHGDHRVAGILRPADQSIGAGSQARALRAAAVPAVDQRGYAAVVYRAA